MFIKTYEFKSWLVCNFWSFNFWNNVSIFQEQIKKLKFVYTFYQFRNLYKLSVSKQQHLC